MRHIFLRKKIELIVFFIMIIGLMNPIDAKIREMRSSTGFNSVVGRYSHAVVLFYDHSREIKKSNPEQYSQNNRLETVFKTVAGRGAYEEAGIQFLLVNVAKSGLWSTARDYGFKDYPVCVLFKNGSPLSDSSIRGFFGAEQLHTLINTVWGDDIDQLVQQKQEERREIERERALYGPSIGFGFGYPYYGRGWGYPYYGGYGYWRRPGFSFGFGI